MVRKAVLIAIVLFAATITFAQEEKVNPSPLAAKLLEKYQAVKTYHAVWDMPSIDKRIKRTTMEVAFERKTGKIFFASLAILNDPKANHPVGNILIYDGKMFHSAVRMTPGGQIEKQTQPPADPNKVSYRDIRRRLGYARPFDLPLMCSETPFMEILQGQVHQFTDSVNEPTKQVILEIMPNPKISQTSAKLMLDPNSLLMEEFGYLDPRMPPEMKGKMFFKLRGVKINKPLSKRIFQLDKQIKKLETPHPKPSARSKAKKKAVVPEDELLETLQKELECF